MTTDGAVVDVVVDGMVLLQRQCEAFEGVLPHLYGGTFAGCL